MVDIVSELRAQHANRPTPRNYAADLAARAADEIERLRAALAPFNEAYRLGSSLCKSQNLGDWESLAKHHTKAGAYRAACLAMSITHQEPKA